MRSRSTGTGLTLTQASFFARQTIKFGAFAIVFIIIGQMFLSAFTTYWIATHPTPPPPPTVGFGVLPAPQFQTGAKNKISQPKTYKLETATIGLGHFPKQLRVYLMPKKAPNLLDHENAMKLAKKYGFVFEPEVIDDNHYRWIKPGKLTRTFDLNIISHTFSYKTDFLEKPELLLESKDLPTKYEAVGLVKDFLHREGPLAKDIATASGQARYLKIVGNDLEPALAASEADLMQIDINRLPVNQIPTYTQRGEQGIIHALLSGYGSGVQRIVKLRNDYYPVDYLTYETYPLKNVKEAWNLLIAGHGYIAAHRSTSDRVVVREVNLGYYDDLNGSQYLEPIFVFKGDDGFLGYVPAIDARYLATKKGRS